MKTINLHNLSKPKGIDKEIFASTALDWLYVIIYLGLILRFCYPFFSNPTSNLTYSDPHRHYVNCFHFGHSIESIVDPPLPQLILIAALKSFGTNQLGIATYFGLLCAATPWFWYRWGREIFSTKIQALVFVTLIIYLPSWIGIYAFFQDETLLLPFMGASLWLSWRANRNKKAN